MTDSQNELFELEQYSGNGATCLAVDIFINGEANMNLALESVHELIEKNDIFHFEINNTEKEPVWNYVDNIDLENYSGIKEFDNIQEYSDWVNEQIESVPSVLEKLFAFTVVCVNGKLGLFFVINHIIADAWTLSKIGENFVKLYNAKLIGDSYDVKLNSYIKLMQDENEYVNSERDIKDKEFWKDQMTKCNELVVLANHPANTMKSDRVQIKLSYDKSKKIIDFCKEEQISEYVLYIAAMGAVFHEQTQADDFYIGSTLLNRTGRIRKNALGLFANTVPIYISYKEKDMSIFDYITSVKKSIGNVFRHQKHTYNRILKENNIGKIFDVSLNYQSALLLDDILLDANVYPAPEQVESLIVHVMLTSDKQYNLFFDYQKDTFDKWEMEMLQQHMLNFIDQVIDNWASAKGENINNINLITEKEKELILNDFNDTKTLVRGLTIDEMFEEQVSKYPEKNAIIFEDEIISYKTLDNRANYVAMQLRDKGVKTGDFVAISASKSIGTVVAMLGVLKSGAAFVPIDPEYPQDRIDYIINDCKPAVFMVTNTADSISTSIKTIVVDKTELDETKEIEKFHNKNDIAYVIYTSGTTGRPKGVLVEHYGIESLRAYFQNDRGISDADVIMQFASFSFDAAISEITMSILSGATMCIVTENIRNDIDLLKEYLLVNEVTAGIFPPQYLTQIKSIPFKLLITAGSETNQGIIEKFYSLNKTVYSNDYGPTEGTVCATAWKYEGGKIPKNIPIGGPIANKQIYIMRDNKLCGIGVSGELCIAGEGLARGYLNQPEFTAEKFIDNPFGEGRLYRTGDRARWNKSGEIEFLGRIDNQVKIRGFRIEVAEIESIMRSVEGVEDAAVVVRRNELQNENYLEAFYTVDSDISYEKLVTVMRKKLPSYMIPSHIYQASEIPLNRNGKVDVAALAKFKIDRNKKKRESENNFERMVLETFMEVIGNSDLGMDDNFFEEGGDSIKAIEIVGKLKEKGIFVNVKSIIQTSTMSELCKAIAADDGSKLNTSNEIILTNRDKGEKYLPLTDIQKEIYLGSELDTQGIAYNVPIVIKFKNKLELHRAQNAVDELQKRHVSLRTGIVNSEEGLKQFYREPVDYKLDRVVYDNVDTAFKEFLKPFNLEEDLLFRMQIAEVNGSDYLMFDSHHIVVDGLSMNVLFSEFINIYNGQVLEDKTIDFDDYVKWNTDSESQKIMETDLDYWEKVFADGVEKTLIPTDFERNGEISNEGETVYSSIEGELYEAINGFCSKNSVTPFMLLMSAYGVLAYKLTLSKNIIIGVPTSGRFVEKTNNMVGMFVSSLPFVINVETGDKFINLVNGVGDNLLEILQHQNCTMNQMAGRLDLSSENGQNPFFSTMFGVNDVVNPENIDYELVEFEQNQAKFDITFDVNREGDKWKIVLRYNRNLYKNESMQKFVDRYMQILKQVVVNPNMLVRDISILSDSEQNKLLFKNNNSKVKFEKRNTNVVSLFHEQTLKTPGAIAVAFKNTYMTYSEIDKYSTVLADILVEKGICKGKILPILTERSVEMLVMELAIMKTGAGFCPMDPAWPQERKELIAKRLNASFILTGSGCHDNDLEHMEISMQKIKEAFDEKEKVNESWNVYDGKNINGADTFYVIYTSGSTGEPKGVVVPYRGIINRLMWMNDALGAKACLSVLLTTNYIYDSSIWQFYWPLINGGKTVVPGPQDMLTADYLLEIIEKEKIGIVDFVPSVFNTIVEGMESAEGKSHALDSLTWVILGGEEIKPKAVNRFITLFPHIKCINLYGPTEASIGCIYKTLIGNNNTTIPIGKPISNVDILILDNDMKLVPEGICGEIYIGGICLADGYYGDEERTSQSFIQNPFAQINSDRLYKTGDLAKWDKNGDIYYLGRSDSQVKIRGFRIELQEIEAKILNYKGIKECIVLAVDRNKDDKVLCAYIVGDVTENELKNYLVAQIPEYMVPSYYVKLDKIPTSASGKANRKMLPKPDFSVKKHNLIAPSNDKEAELLQAWKSVLKNEEISTDDNYFEIGGDSIKALQIVSMLRRKNIEFTMPQLFANPTIMQLAKVVEVKNDGTENNKSDFCGELELSPIQKRYFEKYDLDKHFNQTAVLENKDMWDKEALAEALKACLNKHPMIRTKYEIDKDLDIKQTVLSNEDFNCAINEAYYNDDFEKLQSKVTPLNKIFECTLIKNKESEDASLLMLAVNHLVIDAVSMRILIKDLVTAYEALKNGNTKDVIALLGTENKTYNDFVRAIGDAGNNYHFTKHKAYWEKIDTYKSEDSVTTAYRDRQNFEVKLSKEISDSLITKANNPYKTKTEELILTVVLNAMKKTKVDDSSDIVFDLEAMGRNVTGNEMDFAETVGWFTAIYPVHFRNGFDKLSEQLIEVKEELRAVPDKGVGYQLLNSVNEVKDSRYSFNYLGDFSVPEISESIRLRDISNSSMIHPENTVPYAMDISAYIRDRVMTISVDYVRDIFDEDTISAFKKEIENTCSLLCEELDKVREAVKTPSDLFRLEGEQLSLKELHSIYDIAGYSIEKIYPLSATQTGMLFHSIADGGNGAYFEQNYLTIKGNIEVEYLKKAYRKLIEQNDIFRTVFVYDGLEKNYQVVKLADSVETSFEVVDIQNESNENQNRIIEAYCEEDRLKGFDLQKDSLMRVKAFRISEDSWKLVWSDHHILMDGMCLAMILERLTVYYNDFCEGREISEETISQYEDYITWLQDQNPVTAEEYWKNEVIDFEKQKELYKGGSKLDKTQEELIEHLNKNTVDGLQALATDNGLTLNAVMQAAWAVTLMRYQDTLDVVYGSVVSGRSVPIDDVGRMIGLFISTLPIRIKAEENAMFVDVAKQMLTKCAMAETNSYYPLSEIQKYSEYGSQLFDHIFVFENFDFLNTSNSNANNKNGFEIIEASANETTNYDLTVVVVPREEVLISFMYKKSAFTDEFMQQLMRHYINVLNQIADKKAITIDEIEVLDAFDLDEIDYNEAFGIGYPDVSITELFNRQVQKFPDRIAIQYKDVKYTYKEVDELANRVANTLISKGIETENIIGILMNKNAKAIISAIGILKAGGAYMPLDPSYPTERLEFMIEDSNASFVLIDEEVFDVNIACSVIDIATDLSDDVEATEVDVKPENLAYIIYTSGTTGKPKGAMIVHRNVVRLFMNDECLYDFDENDVWVMFHSFCFDFSVWEMYGALLFGGKLIIITKDFARDTYKFMKLLETEGVTVLNQTPSAFNALSLQLEMEPSVELKVRYLIFGGEKLHPAVLKYFHNRFNNCKIINMYGITETTVHVTYKEITDYEIEENLSDIGVAIPTLGLMLVDSRLKPVPKGIQGEIIVWGHGVCRGYLNRPELTSEKFVDIDIDSNGNKVRVYRSGDAGRYINNGLEYIGRIDQQVKIRGHRIELAEIKNSILKNDKIEDCVVIVDADADDNRTIIAYYQVKNGKTIDAHELRSFEEEHLPAYMVSAHFIEIESIPLNVNGKVDKKALPKPDIKTDTDSFEAPVTELQIYIAKVWEQILNYSPVGLNDNYFEIGGDSIKVIKILSRLHADGYHFEVGDLFAHPTIKEFESYIRQNKNSYKQEEVTGDVKLTAIQSQLAKDSASKTNQYNQMVMLKSDEAIYVTSLQKALRELVIHHDALRSVYVESDSDKLLRIRKSDELDNIDFIRVENISDFTNELDEQKQIEKICIEEQEKININSDKLYSLTLFKTNDADYIFFIIHHMVVDVVSWNIIAEDLIKLYMAAEKHEKVELPYKTMSFMEWSEFLHSEEAHEEVHQCYESIWKEISMDHSRDKNIAIWDNENYGLFTDTKELEFDISGETAEELRTRAFEVLSANMEEVLVAVTAKAIADTSNKDYVALAIESNGRFAKDKDIDVSRTVGWFTSIYPLVLKAGADPVRHLCYVKEKRRKIKDIEYSFNIAASGLEGIFVRPQISFNYLGEIEDSEGSFNMVNMPCGSAVGSDISRDYAVDISCKIIEKEDNKKLHFTIAYSNSVVDEAWAVSLKKSLTNTIYDYISAISLDDNKKISTPSDYGLDIGIDEMQYLEAIYGNQSEDYVKMTPMQKGMLYHVVSNPDDDANYERLKMKISGDFSLELLQKALIIVQKKYPTLRTAFVNDNISEPVQVILKKGITDIELVDGREMTSSEIDDIKSSFDRKPFVPGKGNLSGLLLIQVGGDSYEVIWRFHHLILDGWSMSQVLEEIFNTYSLLAKNNANELEAVSINDASIDIYKYIGKQNRYYAKSFWKNYLNGREINTQIPFGANKGIEASSDSETLELDFYVDEESTKALAEITKNNVTTASIVLSAWGLLLQMAAGADEAVFGSVVSGRNIQIEEVNSAVGMFINTVPICTSLQEGEAFIDSVKRLQEDLVNAEQYSYYPLYEIQSDMNQGNPVISHTVAFENYPVNEVLKKGLESGEDSEFSVDEVSLKEHTNYGIGAVFTPGDRLKLNITYNSNVLTEANCQKLGNMFCHLIKKIAENPFIQIKDINLLDKEDELELVKDYKAEETEVLSLMEQFEKTVKENASSIAVKDSEYSFSYSELDEITNGLAKKLSVEGVEGGNVVALMCGPGVYQAIGILGIMKAEAVYLPIDTSLPFDRIKYMLENSKAVRIVTDSSKEELAKMYDLPVSLIDVNEKESHIDRLGVTEKSEDAYIIYTSGTTGKPKGVLVTKKNIAVAINWRSNEYKLDSSDAVLQLFSYAFDGFMTSFFTPIVSGSKVVFVEDVLDIKRIGELIESENITHFISVPMLCQSIFENLNEEQLKSLRIITTAGDRLGEQTYQIVKEKNPNVEVVNEYGPTECTVVSTIKRNVTLNDIAENSIGKIIDIGYVYIVDKYMHMLPAGIEGEMVVGGAGVSKGYINAPELTEKVFVKDNWREGLNVYRTGDKGKLLENGEIGFWGRVDKQVKLRGYRIETQEIETIMESMENVDNAAVAVKTDKLVAYYTGTKLEENIKEYIATKVPKYMVPDIVVKLDKIPQTKIGKTDYKKLPDPEIKNSELVMPNTADEKIIWDIWENVLGHSKFGVTDNFFDVGGNSIRLMSVYGQINKLYPDKLTVASLFSLTTVKAISDSFVSETEQIEEVSDELTEDDILDALNSDNLDLDDLISKL